MYYNWECLAAAHKRLIADGIAAGRAFGGPYHLVLFPTNRCNFSCSFCTRSDRTSELDWPVLHRALQEAGDMGTRGISMAGGGEPLLYRHMGRLADYMSRHSLRFYALTTNGSLITEEMASMFTELDMRWLTVSLNETDPAAHGSICGATPRQSAAVLEGLARVERARRLRPSGLQVRAQVFIGKDNFRRLPDMVAQAAATGADFVFVNTLDGLPADRRMNACEREELKELLNVVLREWGPRLQFRLGQEGLQRYVEVAQHQVAPEAVQMEDMCSGHRRIEFCYVGWYAPMISADGKVYPCCPISGNARASVGSLHTATLRRIWNGADYNRFRREMRHLLLTGSAAHLLPGRMRFIAPACMERAACNINYYLCDPAFYGEMDAWADSRRAAYMHRQRVRKDVIGALRRLPGFRNA